MIGKKQTTPEPHTISAQEFGKRVYKAMQNKGWRQSDLARAADLSRENISGYVNGRNMPTRHSLVKLAKALGVQPDDLLPNHTLGVPHFEETAFSISLIPDQPGKANVYLKKVMSMDAASKIATIVSEDADVSKR